MEKQLEARKKKLQQEEGAKVNKQFHCTVPGCETVLKSQKVLNSHLQSNAHISAEDGKATRSKKKEAAAGGRR